MIDISTDEEYAAKFKLLERMLTKDPHLNEKLEDPDEIFKHFVKTFAQCSIALNTITQDILSCKDSLDTLDNLNEKGRALIKKIREEMDKMSVFAKDFGDAKYEKELQTQRHILSGLLKDFKEVNVKSMFAIEKNQREDLFRGEDGVQNSTLRNRKQKIDSDGLMKMSTGVTEQLLSISRQLADTTQRSQDTLDSLVSSSTTVHGTKSELQNTAGTISQSSKLLTKYGRREFTDKVIMFFAFLFFLAVCLYIVQKRLF